MAPEIQQAGGAAQQWTHDFPTLARMYETAMQGATQASIAGASIAQRNMEARAQAANQAYATEVSRQQHADALAASRQVSPRDQFLAAVHMQEQEQRAQLRAWVNQQELSQADVMQHQRLQNGLGALTAAHNSGLLSDDEYYTGVAQLQSPLNLLSLKMQAQAAKQMDQQKKMALDAEAQGMSIEQLHAQQRAKDFEEGVIHRKDGSEWYLDPKGALHPLNSEASQAQGKGTGTGAVEREEARYEKARKEWIDQYREVVKETDARIKAGLVGEGKSLPGFPTIENRSQAIVDSLRGQGLPTNSAEFDAMWKEKRHSIQKSLPGEVPTGAGGGLGQTEGAGQGTGEGGPAIVPAPPPTENDLKALQPFDRMKPETMAPIQKQQISFYTGVHDDLRQRTDLPEEKRWAAEDATTEIMYLLERHGSFQRMPKSEQEKYLAAEKVLARIPANPKPRGAKGLWKAIAESDFGGHS